MAFFYSENKNLKAIGDAAEKCLENSKSPKAFEALLKTAKKLSENNEEYIEFLDQLSDTIKIYEDSWRAPWHCGWAIHSFLKNGFNLEKLIEKHIGEVGDFARDALEVFKDYTPKGTPIKWVGNESAYAKEGRAARYIQYALGEISEDTVEDDFRDVLYNAAKIFNDSHGEGFLCEMLRGVRDKNAYHLIPVILDAGLKKSEFAWVVFGNVDTLKRMVAEKYRLGNKFPSQNKLEDFDFEKS